MMKVAIVTGASSGIGLSLAEKLVARGYKVALVARTAKKLEEIAAKLEGAYAFPLDVTDLAALEALPGEVVKKLGQLDVVVNNAGLNHRGAVDTIPSKDLVAIINTNLIGPIVLTRAAIPHLAKGGSIIQLGSIAGMVPVPHEATYSASKAGLRAFARAAAEDLAAKDIHVGSVCPGPVDTGFLGDYENVPDLVFSQPMSTSEEVADAVLRCIDERCDEIAIPAKSGRLATMAYLVPSFARKIRPVLEKRGARNKAALLAKRRSMS